MKHFAQSLCGTALAFCLAAVAQADVVDWRYNWTPSSPTIFADSGDSHIALTNEPTGAATGSSDIVATDITTFSDAPPDAPATFTHKAYSLKLTLTDGATHDTGSVVFAGEFNGKLSSLNANITNTFTSPTTQALELGGNHYTVKIGPYAPPAPPTAANSGSIAAHAEVSVRVLLEGPEPPGLVLAALGVCGLGLGSARWRARRWAARLP
jgi:hypothetical protein